MGTRKSRKPRTSKKVYYFIVEGCTEENYIKLLKIIFKKDAVIKNCRGGNAKSVLQEAKKIIVQNKDEYLGYVVWFDGDRYNPSSDTNLKQSVESKAKTQVYMSLPCIENWLLAHFEKVNLDEAECKVCEKKLSKHYIPDYKKNDCSLLQKYINRENIEQAIARYPEIGAIPQKYFLPDESASF